MGITVKICGLANGPDAAAVSALKPDVLGFIFWSGSPRSVTAEQVADWLPELDDGILRAGVFVDASADEIRRTVDVARLNIVQLHGSGPPEAASPLGEILWQVVHLDQPLHTRPDVDAYLIDSYTEKMPGGTGLRADWKAAAAFVQDTDRPVILAGGLTPDNVSEALRQVQPAGVDVSSGVEAEKGRKDLANVKAFIEACRKK